MIKWLDKFEAARPFTEAEAWLLYRIAAYAEAVGWTLLIAGILIDKYTGNTIAVFIAGNIHGMIYFAYFIAALGLYPSLGWSRWRGIVATLAGIPPYGSLLFELYAAHKRGAHGFKSYRHYLIYTTLAIA